MRVGDITIKIDGENISLIQPDPITGFKHWIIVTVDELKQINEILCPKV